MNRRTQEALVAVNHKFYAEHAASFDGTRSAPWQGWTRLLNAMADGWSEGKLLRVLDVGCGNGRFGSLVEKQWSGPWSYLGLDSSEELLQAASTRLDSLERRELRTWDFLEGPLKLAAPGAYDLVAIFGVLHHVPGAALRRDLLLQAAMLLAPGGCLAFTVWRFGEDTRFERRVVPWDSPSLERLEKEELEAGDVLLRWGDGEGALRYCHAADDDEQNRWVEDLAEESSLDLELRFAGDGKTGQLNRYFLLRKA